MDAKLGGGVVGRGKAGRRVATEDRLKAVLYIRVSSAEQANSGVSLEAQRVKLEAYCALKGLEIVETLVEPGVSAFKPLDTRPQGQAMLAALEAGRAFHVVALKLDRLFRNTADALSTTASWEKKGVSMHLVDMGGNAVDTSTATGKIMLGMLAGFAEFERNLTSERTKAALSHQKSTGKAYSGARDPFGYRRRVEGGEGGTVVNHLEPDPETQAVLARMKALRHDDGLSYRQIATALTEHGIATVSGGQWQASTVKGILDREC